MASAGQFSLAVQGVTRLLRGTHEHKSTWAEDIVPGFLRELINVPETPSSEEETNAVAQGTGIDIVVSQPLPAIPQSEGATERSSSSATIDGAMESRPASSWDDPDTYFVQAQRLVGPEVPLQVLGAGSRNLLQNIVRALGAPMVYALLALLVSTATVFGCARRIRVTSGWVEPSLLGGILVGPPGALKSPTCDAFIRALFMIEAHEGQMHHEHYQRLADARLVATVRDKVYSQEVHRAVLAGAPPPPRLHVTAVDLRDPPAPALVSTSGSPEGFRHGSG
ncbi:DUF3987 domain-containing protein [Microvirga sp. BSC39]|uniref:DUF3987 domain-containing protein n=1 Tax=Microvirga sp. BSC39 TaxID=1549810 RepID=UPI001269EC4B|nr:DUF3987 domain-containing protein [Microvirga sp. BSC39]